MANEYPTVTLYTDSINDYDALYKDYCEWCRENGQIPQEDGSNEYWDWVNREQGFAWQEFCDNINFSEYSDVPFVISGSLGLWYGRRQIQPVVQQSLYDAVLKCCKTGDNSTITLVNGVINIQVSHHDGTNYFQIHLLSQRGINYYYNHDRDLGCQIKPYMVKKIKGYLN